MNYPRRTNSPGRSIRFNPTIEQNLLSPFDLIPQSPERRDILSDGSTPQNLGSSMIQSPLRPGCLRFLSPPKLSDYHNVSLLDDVQLEEPSFMAEGRSFLVDNSGEEYFPLSNMNVGANIADERGSFLVNNSNTEFVLGENIDEYIHRPNPYVAPNHVVDLAQPLGYQKRLENLRAMRTRLVRDETDRETQRRRDNLEYQSGNICDTPRRINNYRYRSRRRLFDSPVIDNSPENLSNISLESLESINSPSSRMHVQERQEERQSEEVDRNVRGSLDDFFNQSGNICDTPRRDNNINRFRARRKLFHSPSADKTFENLFDVSMNLLASPTSGRNDSLQVTVCESSPARMTDQATVSDVSLIGDIDDSWRPPANSTIKNMFPDIPSIDAEDSFSPSANSTLNEILPDIISSPCARSFRSKKSPHGVVISEVSNISGLSQIHTPPLVTSPGCPQPQTLNINLSSPRIDIQELENSRLIQMNRSENKSANILDDTSECLLSMSESSNTRNNYENLQNVSANLFQSSMSEDSGQTTGSSTIPEEFRNVIGPLIHPTLPVIDRSMISDARCHFVDISESDNTPIALIPSPQPINSQVQTSILARKRMVPRISRPCRLLGSNQTSGMNPPTSVNIKIPLIHRKQQGHLPCSSSQIRSSSQPATTRAASGVRCSQSQLNLTRTIRVADSRQTGKPEVKPMASTFSRQIRPSGIRPVDAALRLGIPGVRQNICPPVARSVTSTTSTRQVCPPGTRPMNTVSRPGNDSTRQNMCPPGTRPAFSTFNRQINPPRIRPMTTAPRLGIPYGRQNLCPPGTRPVVSTSSRQVCPPGTRPMNTVPRSRNPCTRQNICPPGTRPVTSTRQICSPGTRPMNAALKSKIPGA